MTVEVRHLHSSGRFDRKPRTLRADLDDWTPGHDVITFTEVAGQARAKALKRKGWRRVRGKGPANRRECAILFDRDRFRLLHRDVTPLTKATGPARLARPVCATTVVLADRDSGAVLLFSVAHLPAHVEGASGWRRVPVRLRVYFTAVPTWRRHVQHLRDRYEVDGTWVGGDWNINTRRAVFRGWLRRQWRGTGLRLAFPRAATIGRHRPIDGGVTDMDHTGPRPVRARSSDHKAITQTFHLTIKEHR